jgi:hypothetical protein
LHKQQEKIPESFLRRKEGYFERDKNEQMKDLPKSNELIFREVIIFRIKDWIFTRSAGANVHFIK